MNHRNDDPIQNRRRFLGRKRMPRGGVSRRTMLRALGLGGAGLFLPSLVSRRAHADTVGAAKRIVFFVTSHGTVYDNWKMRPMGQSDDGDWEFGLTDMADTDFSRILQPLHGMRNKLLVLDGVANGAGPISAINEHESGHAGLLTGRSSTEVSGQLAVPDGPSVDQAIASFLADQNLIRSLEYSIGGWPVCFNDLGQSIPYEGDPFAAWDRLFPGGVSEPGMPTDEDLIRIAQPSVLDFVGQRYESMYGRLSTEDRVKVELHRDLLFDLENQLRGLAELECEPIPQPSGLPQWDTPEYPTEYGRVFNDLTRVALSCSMTQVVTIRHDVMPNSTVMAPPGDLHNDFAHQASTDPEAGEIMTRYHEHQANLFRELIEALDQIPEGNGTLLDNTICVWWNELSTGEHTMSDMPIVIAGGGGYFDMGRYVHWGKADTLEGPWSQIPMGPAHNKLLTNFARAMGLEIDSFGLTELPRANGGTIDTTGTLDRVAIE